MMNMFANKNKDTEDAKEEVAEESTAPTVDYVSRHISKLRLGRFQFENGRLSLTPEEAEDFDNLLKGASLRTRQSVEKIDVGAAEAVARKFLEQNKGSMIRGGDTSTGAPPAPKPGESDPPKSEGEAE